MTLRNVLRKLEEDGLTVTLYGVWRCLHDNGFSFKVFVNRSITCSSQFGEHHQLISMTGIAHTELKEVNKCHFLTTKGP